VVIQKNDYGVDLFNGDDGVVSGDKAFFSSANDLREISKARLPSYQDAFALSIHRSQGSEYERVMIVLPPPEAKLLNRELLYVAVSRAKKEIILVGDPESIVSAVQQEAEVQCGVVELM
jgi:exodeoxyribonuclease V alpha subunit